jgi:subtilisin family serine protease
LSSLPDSAGDPLYDLQWHLGAANIPAAWQWLEDHGLPPGGNRDIIVAVIDTGVDFNHPDLAANMWTNSREIAGNGLDDDGNGFADDIHGVNVVSNIHSGDPMDDHGHGTHVAGIIAAQAGNSRGGVGVAYNVQIMAIKAAQYSGCSRPRISPKGSIMLWLRGPMSSTCPSGATHAHKSKKTL